VVLGSFCSLWAGLMVFRPRWFAALDSLPNGRGRTVILVAPLAAASFVSAAWGPLPLIFAGLLITGAAVALRPQSPFLLVGAAFSAYLARAALEWDSIRLLIAVLIAIALVAAVLLLPPRLVRQTIVILLVLFHFGGILSAVSSVPPNPWLSQY